MTIDILMDSPFWLRRNANGEEDNVTLLNRRDFEIARLALFFALPEIRREERKRIRHKDDAGAALCVDLFYEVGELISEWDCLVD